MLPSSLSKGLFNQLMLLVLPGTLATISLFVNLHFYFSIKKYESFFFNCENHMGLFYFLAFVLILIAGIILENIGSRIECHIDECYKINSDKWYKYLFDKCEGENSRIIHKYIDNISFRFKMELSLMPAFLICIICWIFLYGNDHVPISCNMFYITLITLSGILWYISFEAISSAKLLERIREEYFSYKEK